MQAVRLLRPVPGPSLTRLYIASQDPTTGLRYLEPGLYTSTTLSMEQLVKVIIKLCGYWPKHKIVEVVGYD
jgi:hypothetical protein